jgi:hypothetical protein
MEETMSNPYSVASMVGKWFSISIRLGVRFLARLGPIAERWDRALTPTEHLNDYQIRRQELENTHGPGSNKRPHKKIEDRLDSE